MKNIMYHESGIRHHALEAYLREVFGPSVRLLEFERLGAGVHGTGFLLTIETEEGRRSYVLKDLSPEGLGHDYPSDRAAVFLLANETYGKLPRHIKAIDVITIKENGTMKSTGGGVDYFLLMEKAEGENYFNDLTEFSKKGSLDEKDIKKIKAMTSYLAEIHSLKKDSKTLYWRKLRDTIGHGECLMGVFDSYPDGTLTYDEMAEIVKKSVDWNARLKPKYKRLSQIHGDFHPGNIWFKAEGGLHPPSGNPLNTEIDFVLLDRSRGPWGEPADDVTALTINYVFFSIKHHFSIEGPYLDGLRLFYESYVALTGDDEIYNVVAPFYAFRGAVVANPVFYPEVTPEQRRLIFRFVNNVLDTDGFEPGRINDYLR
ncbi:MAG: phosphotransferase [Thermodesulfovibrionales bacterium]|nr:phosphotransferase [Thermodesulfovibrionales bacterium]